MQQMTLKYQINLDNFTAQLFKEMNGSVAALRVVLKALKEGSFEGIGNYAEENNSIVHRIDPVPEAQFIREQELNKCFKAIVTSIQDYLDRLIAVVNFANEKHVPPREALSDQQKLNEFVQKKFLDSIREVAEDKKLTVPSKLDRLGVDGQVRELLLNYFRLRNTLEHHKGVSSEERKLVFKRLSLVTTAGREMTVPGILEEGEGLGMKIIDEEIVIPAEKPIVLEYSQIENITFTVNFFIVAQLIQRTKALLNEKIEEVKSVTS